MYDFWDYSRHELKKRSKRKPYVIRFRLKYAVLLGNNFSATDKIKDATLRILALINLVKNLIYFQLFKSFKPKGFIYILISNNPVYLHTMIPVIRHFSKNGVPFVLMAPANQIKKLKKKLPVEISQIILPFESLQVHNSKVVIVAKIVVAFVRTILDMIWFSFQNLKQASLLAPALSRFSMTEYFFNPGLSKIFSSESKLIAANDHWMWESLFYSVANNNGASTYVLQHGIIANLSYPLFAKHFLAWGIADAEIMINELGASADEIIIAGSPHFDEVYLNGKTHKISEDQWKQPYITFLSQPFHNTGVIPNEYYEKILSIFGSLKELAERLGKKLIIKLHPSDKPETYQKILPKIEAVSKPLFEILAQSCLCLTFDSTALFESIFFKIPTIQIIPVGEARKIDFSDSGLTDIVENKVILKDLVLSILSTKEEYNSRVLKGQDSLSYYYSHLGHSLKEIESIILQNSNRH